MMGINLLRFRSAKPILPKWLRLMARGLLAFSMLSIAGCVMWPQNVTYYEAVDRPWKAAAREGTFTSCPWTDYGQKSLGQTSVWLSPSYDAGAGQIRASISIHHGDALTFQTWRLRFTSLADPRVQSSIPLKFYVNCPKQVESCPRTPTEPRAQNGPEGAPTNLVDNFDGIANVPAEFIGGFILELQGSDNGPMLDLKPQKFELRTKVLARGTFGCY